MSSPGGVSGAAHWQAPTAQNPSQAGSNEPDEEGVIVKLMRLKVLYTFDDENKTNCLARWPNVLQVKTVQMDETATIGVVELKTCIEAIVQCSPEIVAKLGQDYTVYAYDYSEYDHPQVGQGLLSRALAAASPTPDAPAYQSRQLITGRVCKNIQGLFSNGVKETLEVKLRLVPVPTVLQHEYLSTMEKYRELTKIIPPGVDHNEWSTFLQSNPSIAQMANKINAPVAGPNKRDGVSMEVVNQLLSPSIAPENSVDPFNVAVNNGGDSRASTPGGGRKTAAATSRPSSRASVKRPRKPRNKSVAAGGNTSGYEEGTDGDDVLPTKKRAKIQKADWKSKSSFGSGSDSLRVAASTAGSLRLFRPIAVAPASNSAPGSHLQEVPRAPTPVPNMPGQGMQRGRSESQSGLRRNSVASNYATSQQQYNSPYNSLYENPSGSQDLARPSIESPMTSPEKDDSSGETPPDIASSPPVLRTATPMRSSPPIPSSPVLPQMPRTDSGFMSGDVSDLFEDEDDVMRPIDDEDVATAAKYTRRRPNPNRQGPKVEVHHGFAIQEVTPGPVELLPTKMFPRAEPKQYMERLDPKYRPITPREDSTMSDDFQSFPTMPIQTTMFAPNYNMSQPSPIAEHCGEMPPPMSTFEPSQTSGRPQDEMAPLLSHHNPVPITAAPSQAPSLSRPASRMMSRTASSGSLTMPSIPASDPVLPPSTLHRSQTWSEAPHPPTDDISAFSSRVPRGSTAGVIAKKNSIRSRLETAISKGESPPFCKNCGAIETPTWRKAWAKEIEGDPGFHEYSDEPGKVTAIDILTKDEAGKPTSYRLIKKSLLNSEDKTGFEQLLLCNPCGIWMSKYKTQRPSDKWQVDPKKPGKKRDRNPKTKQTIAPYYSNYPVPTSEAYYYPSDAPGPYLQSDAPAPIEYVPLAPMPEPSQHYQPPPVQQSSQQDELPALPVQRQRASSLRPVKSTKAMTSDIASAALRRAIQSSPARWMGSRHSPIELEEDLGSTRRLLFPSPCKDASPKVLGEVAVNVMQSAVHFRSPTRSKDQLIENADKENCPPSPLFGDMDDDIMKLFEEEISRPSRPTTPVQKSPPKNLFKTPTRPTPSHRPVTRSVSRSAKSARGSMMPQRTPSSGARRRSPRNHPAVFESPFTATLNKLLSEANENPMNHSPSRNLDLGIDFSLPDLGHSTAGMHSDSMTFQLPGFDPNHDFFSTDVPMPSSPPKFDLYEDPIVSMMDPSMWSDFHMDEHAMNSMSAGLSIDEHGRATFEMGMMATGNEAQVKADPGTPVVESEMQKGNEAENTA